MASLIYAAENTNRKKTRKITFKINKNDLVGKTSIDRYVTSKVSSKPLTGIDITDRNRELRIPA